VALGGDGIIHEVVNGLMTLSADARPAPGRLPPGPPRLFTKLSRFCRGFFF